MILLIDIGNTSTKVATYNIKTNKLNNYSAFLTCKKKTILKIIDYKKNKKIKYCLISSVVPAIYKIIKKRLSKNKIKVFEFKDKKIKKNIMINVKKKSQVGSDRIVNAIGSLNSYKKNCIIIDFGTATTFDIVLIKNIYQGGIIAPGINLSLKSLSEFTAKLPLIKIFYQKNVIGKDTKSAINSGVYIGYSCLINGIIEKIIKQTKKNYLIVLTGGYSKIFKKNINYKTVINKNITLHGLATIVRENNKIFNEV
tara:strand:- start:1024 stop:1785 length:762 start_codon:yes stop_codon:yes gene_type:complete